MLEILLIAVSTLHLLTVGLATSAPLVCMWLDRRRRDDDYAGRAGRWLAWHSMTSLAGGIVLGFLSLALLWLIEGSAYLDALAVVPRRRLWFGLVELVFFFACMFAYWKCWDIRPEERRWRLIRGGLAVLAATDLLYHFPPLFAAVTVLVARPELPASELGYREFLALMANPEALARVMHFSLASLVIAGTTLIVYALKHPDQQGDLGPSRRLATAGARLALAAGLLQVLAGLFLLLKLTATERHQLLGGDMFSTVLFALGMAATLGLLHHLATISLGSGERSEMARSVALLILVVLLMVAARHASRREMSVGRSLSHFPASRIDP